MIDGKIFSELSKKNYYKIYNKLHKKAIKALESFIRKSALTGRTALTMYVSNLCDYIDAYTLVDTPEEAEKLFGLMSILDDFRKNNFSVSYTNNSREFIIQW